jgi:hypothetical protein
MLIDQKLSAKAMEELRDSVTRVARFDCDVGATDVFIEGDINNADAVHLTFKLDRGSVWVSALNRLEKRFAPRGNTYVERAEEGIAVRLLSVPQAKLGMELRLKF